jgi:hypothetical protein
VLGTYLLVVDPDDTALDVYNAAVWDLPSTVNPLPQKAKSLAVSGTELLMINDSDGAWVDLSTAATTAVDPPSGLTFAQVSGGRTLVASDGTCYVVGATRGTGLSTNKVLRVAPDGTLHTLLLGTPRLGAAATLVDDALLVAGGSTLGAGAELYSVGAAGFRALDLPADETRDAALVAMTGTTAWLVGGHDGTGASARSRRIDTECLSDCVETELPHADVAVSHTSAFRLDSNVALVVGETEDEQNHAYLLDTSGDTPTLTEQPLKTPRSQASAALLPNGQVALVGGTDIATGEAALGLDVFFY